MFTRRNEAGRSIVEMLGVLAIMGIITVMGIAGYSQAVSRMNRSKTIEDVMRYLQEVNSLFGGRVIPTVAATPTDTAADGNGFPIATTIASVMNVNLTTGFLPAALGTGIGINHTFAQNHFRVTLNGIGQSDCNFFKNNAWNGVVQSNGQPWPTATLNVVYVGNAAQVSLAATAAAATNTGTCGASNIISIFFPL